jgi:hypothetical protein
MKFLKTVITILGYVYSQSDKQITQAQLDEAIFKLNKSNNILDRILRKLSDEEALRLNN